MAEWNRKNRFNVKIGYCFQFSVFSFLSLSQIELCYHSSVLNDKIKTLCTIYAPSLLLINRLIDELHGHDGKDISSSKAAYAWIKDILKRKCSYSLLNMKSID